MVGLLLSFTYITEIWFDYFHYCTIIQEHSNDERSPTSMGNYLDPSSIFKAVYENHNQREFENTCTYLRFAYVCLQLLHLSHARPRERMGAHAHTTSFYFGMLKFIIFLFRSQKPRVKNGPNVCLFGFRVVENAHRRGAARRGTGFGQQPKTCWRRCK